MLINVSLHVDAPPAAHRDHPDRCPVCGEPVAPVAQPGEEPCPACGHLLWFMSERIDGVTVVHLMDSRVAVIELLDLLDHAILDGILDRIVLDFAGIQQVSSAALGKLVKLTGRAKAARGVLKLSGLHADLRQVLRITNLDRIFDVHSGVADALAAFADEAGA